MSTELASLKEVEPPLQQPQQESLCSSFKTDMLSETSSNGSPTTPSANAKFHSYVDPPHPWMTKQEPTHSSVDWFDPPTPTELPTTHQSNASSVRRGFCDFEPPDEPSLEPKSERRPSASMAHLRSPWNHNNIWSAPLTSPFKCDIETKINNASHGLESAFFSRRHSLSAAPPRSSGLSQPYRSHLPSTHEEDYFNGWDQNGRNSTNPSYSSLNSIWSPIPQRFQPSQSPQQHVHQRRFSVTDNLTQSDYWTSLVTDHHSSMSKYYDDLGATAIGRRHSVAGPYLSSPSPVPAKVNSSFGFEPSAGEGYPGQFNDGFSNAYSRQCQQQLDKDIRDHIDEYFGELRITMNPANATPVNYSSDVSCQTVGKGVSLQHFVDSGIPLYKVAFKAGRSELCYLSDKDAWIRLPKMGDLVIIEADRGRDLGTIVADRVNASELCGKEEIMSPPADPLSVTDTGRINPKDVYVKQMFRLAESAEIASLATKSQDEAKALLVCQAKIKQKGLCMEVLNAEYQWDRRKLTFYFVADQRIDFRELVRELFKIYKTRIWMCATKPV